MEVKRKEILTCLESVKPAVATSNPLSEQQTHFIFNKEVVIGYNDDVVIIHPFVSGLRCSVVADKFLKTISKIKQEELEIKFKEEKIKIKTKDTVAEFTTTDNKEMLEIIERLSIPEKGWKKLPKDFLDGLELCVFSAGDNMLEPHLTGIHIKGKNIVSSDDFRISRFIMEEEMKCDVLIPATSISTLLKMNVKRYLINDTWAFFKTAENIIFGSRRLSFDYPDTSEFLKLKGITIKLPSELSELIEKAAIIIETAHSQDDTVEITLFENLATCKAEGPNGKIKTKIKTKEVYEQMIFSVNPTFMLRILKETNEMIYSEDKIKFVIDDNFEHIIAL